MDKHDLRILQVNLGRGRVATAEAVELAYKTKAPIMLIQEPYTFCFRASGLGTYSNQILTGNGDKEVPWACVVILNKDYVATLLKDVSTSHCVCVHISGPSGGFYVISAYLQYSLPVEEVLQQVHVALRKIGNSRVVLGMDVNAVSSLWSSRAADLEDDRGSAVENLISQWNLIQLNREGELCTYKTGNRDIDITLSDFTMAGKVVKWKVLDQMPSTDHRPILVTFGSLPRAERVMKMRFNIAKANWDLHSCEISRLITFYNQQQTTISGPDDVQKLAEAIEEIIVEAAGVSIGKKTNFQKSVPWWNPELTKQKKITNRLRREYQRELDEELRETKRQLYKNHRRKYTKKSLRAKRDSWRSFVETSADGNPYGIAYKIARNRIHFKAATVCVLDGDTYTANWKQTTEVILDGLFGNGENDVPLKCPTQHWTPGTQFVGWDEIEVIKAVKTMRNGKSPGRDLIEVEMVKKAVGAGLLPLLVVLYNSCAKFGVFPKIWKTGIIRVLLKSPAKDPTKVRSYRPVCLLPVLSKVLERLIRSRLVSIIMHPQFASQRQYGFRAKRSTEDAISYLRKSVENSDKKMSLAILIDITGAFDNFEVVIYYQRTGKKGNKR